MCYTTILRAICPVSDVCETAAKPRPYFYQLFLYFVELFTAHLQELQPTLLGLGYFVCHYLVLLLHGNFYWQAVTIGIPWYKYVPALHPEVACYHVYLCVMCRTTYMPFAARIGRRRIYDEDWAFTFWVELV